MIADRRQYWEELIALDDAVRHRAREFLLSPGSRELAFDRRLSADEAMRRIFARQAGPHAWLTHVILEELHAIRDGAWPDEPALHEDVTARGSR